MKKQIFISYSADDKVVAAKLCEFLENRSIACWIAPRDVVPGAQFEEAILAAIDQTQSMVVILSKNTAESPFVKNEVNRAFAKGRTIFTFRVEDVSPTGALEFYLARHHWTDGFPPPLDERFARLGGAIAALVGAPSPPMIEPAQPAGLRPNIVFSAGNIDDVPRPGELRLWPVDPRQREFRAMACLALAGGCDAFAHSTTPINRVVLGADPTFDDMLAAAFLHRLLASQPIPEGSEPFARYAASIRKGISPSSNPPEASIEGVYLAIRNSCPDNLSDPAIGASFLGTWEKMAKVIFASAAAGLDPFRSRLFDGPEFAEERAFLTGDLRVYQEDVFRGEQWRVRIPGEPATQGRGLYLRNPRSLLFRHWSRCTTEVGPMFHFLAVFNGNGQWVFSTDPIQRMSIDSLADVLQAAEKACNSAAATSDLWFSGKPFGHTLVAAPRGGSKLSEAQVLDVVKRWARVPRKRWPIGAFAAGILIALVAWFLAGLWHTAEEFQVTHSQFLGAKVSQIRGVFDPDKLRVESPDDLNVFKRVAPATVIILSPNKGLGTGFLIERPLGTDWIMTCNHVVFGVAMNAKGDREVDVMLGDLVSGQLQLRREKIRAIVYQTSDDDRDLALLRLKHKPAGMKTLPTLVLANKSPKPADPCWAIGHPKSSALWTLRKGRINQVMSDTNAVQTLWASLQDPNSMLQKPKATSEQRILLSDCGLAPGDSGGPLLNHANEVIGVSFGGPAKESRGTLVTGYHVHLDDLSAFLKTAPSSGPTRFIPDWWPPADSIKVARREGCQVVEFYQTEQDGTVTRTGFLADLESKSPRMEPRFFYDPEKRREFTFQYAYQKIPYECAFYDTRNEGRPNLILCDTQNREHGVYFDLRLSFQKGEWTPETARGKMHDPLLLEDIGQQQLLEKIFDFYGLTTKRSN